MTQRIKVYVASLASESARRQSVLEQIDTLGMPVEIVDAIDARGLDAEAMRSHQGDQTYFRSRYGRDMKPGELGCALTHQKIYRRILEDEVDIALVLEDDFWVPQPLPDLPRLLLSMKADWLILGYPARTAFEARHSRWLDPVVVTRHLPGRYVSGVSLRRKNHGTLAYAIRQSAVQRLLEPAIVTVADDHAYFGRRVRIEHLRPMIFVEKPGLVSAISGDERLDGGWRLRRRYLSRILTALPKWLRVLAYRVRLIERHASEPIS